MCTATVIGKNNQVAVLAMVAHNSHPSTRGIARGSNQVKFCHRALQQKQQNLYFFGGMLFSDESTFTKHCKLMGHNMHYWSVENPHWFRQVKHQRQGHKLISPYFTEGSLNSEKYDNFLQDDLPTFLEDPKPQTRNANADRVQAASQCSTARRQLAPINDVQFRQDHWMLSDATMASIARTHCTCYSDDRQGNCSQNEYYFGCKLLPALSTESCVKCYFEHCNGTHKEVRDYIVTATAQCYAPCGTREGNCRYLIGLPQIWIHASIRLDMECQMQSCCISLDAASLKLGVACHPPGTNLLAVEVEVLTSALLTTAPDECCLLNDSQLVGYTPLLIVAGKLLTITRMYVGCQGLPHAHTLAFNSPVQLNWPLLSLSVASLVPMATTGCTAMACPCACYACGRSSDQGPTRPVGRVRSPTAVPIQVMTGQIILGVEACGTCQITAYSFYTVCRPSGVTGISCICGLAYMTAGGTTAPVALPHDAML
ncbi:hypothetical protein PR048_021480, partial [Dryococelus australis]